MIVYLDTSVVLRPLLDQPRILKNWGEWNAAYSSELMGVECRRAIDRLRLDGLYDDKQVADVIEQLGKIERTIKRIPVTRGILQAASLSMPTVVKTLDCIHLVSAIAVRERRKGEILFATHDSQQALAARACGFTCLET
jgi:PIN domain